MSGDVYRGESENAGEDVTGECCVLVRTMLHKVVLNSALLKKTFNKFKYVLNNVLYWMNI